VVFLGEERWLEAPFVPHSRSRGESWIVVDTEESKKVWLVGADESAGTASARSRSGKPSRASRTLPRTLRFEVLRRDGFRCTYCGRSMSEVVLHVDHVQPWSLGGPNTLENLRTACVDCNLGKGATRA
jgi:hypothetical protein